MNCAENIVDTCTERELGVALDIPMMRNAVEDMCSQVDGGYLAARKAHTAGNNYFRSSME